MRREKLKNKIALWMVLVLLFVVAVAFSGCVENGYIEDIDDESITQYISGTDKIQEVSGDTIIISGVRNQVKIINSDISLIQVSGVDNIVYYPQEAKPLIQNSGVRCVVKTFSSSEQPIMEPTLTTIPTAQNINGNYKVQDVSGDTININGNYNEIRILNADVSLIRVNGNDNTVYYPKEARPTIKENGFGNEIKTY